MKITQLRAFDAIAREGSFSKAAAALGLTQPALTIQVAGIERAYGVRLFDRVGRRVELTETGRRLFDTTSRLFELEDAAREMLTASRALTGGRIRVAADGAHIVMGLFARFMELYPRVELSVTLGSSRSVRDELLERRVDIGILPNVGGEAAFEALPIWRHTPVLIVPHGHRWAKRKSASIHDLDGEPIVMRKEGSNTQKELDAALARANVKPRVVLELGAREGVLGAVAAGLGVGVIWHVEAKGDTRFATLDLADTRMRSIDYIACLNSERGRRVVRAMMDVARETFPRVADAPPPPGKPASRAKRAPRSG
ncbi:MAG: LysR family transcriptional regulator [Azospirillum sp.]|nr:LysR family transcriptional regulator [Azospirillum sp.]